ncbi:hypothetical protein RIVM261_061380 [Rivularia sp. IAM M-261]|nr:hypothetical protein CAL7716_036950 [Calothrix sp. PCC 7716]GJD21182.1 hypothetical protein RIVM261_061380 [Rivularia sp. IAM M-261]
MHNNGASPLHGATFQPTGAVFVLKTLFQTLVDAWDGCVVTADAGEAVTVGVMLDGVGCGRTLLSLLVFLNTDFNMNGDSASKIRPINR